MLIIAIIVGALGYFTVTTTLNQLKYQEELYKMEMAYLKKLDERGLKKVCEVTGQHEETRYKMVGKVQQPYKITVPDYTCEVVPK
jgi:hypothetical protein